MTILFSSDLHFGHVKILEYTKRPFDSVPEMNEALIRNWNSVVEPDDMVYVLGDFAMGKIDDTLPLALRLNGTKFLLAGNHDRCWSYNRKKVDEWRIRYEEVGFELLPEQVRLPVNGFGEVLLCHFPYEGDSGDEDRYLAARPHDDGTVLLHGHTHVSEPLTVSSKGTPMINVGVDAWSCKPVTIDELLGLL